MKRMQAIILIALVALFAIPQAFARAGGGVSVGRAAPSPSFSRPSYSAAPAAPRYSAPAAPAPRVNRTTVINNGGGGGGGFGGGFGSSFLGGMAGSVVGNAISAPHAAPVVVAAPGGAMTAPMSAAAPVPYAAGGSTVVVQGSGGGWTWFWFFAFALVAAGLAYFFFWRSQTEPIAVVDPDDMDPLQFFYLVQQAAMNGDVEALRKHCMPGLAAVLAASPEPSRIAVETLRGVVWRHVGVESIEYQFIDTVAGGARVVERWQFADGKLDGIEVVG